MRIIIFGIGAVGGVIAATLSLSGQEVLGIARGTRLRAIRHSGLTLRSHSACETVRLPVVGSPAEIDPHPDDCVLLVTKTQDTPAALDALRAAGFEKQPIFCVQNGVENERLALRLFPNVHGVNVMLPAEYMLPDEVIALGQPNLGVFDMGLYPSGTDAADEALAERLSAARIRSFAVPDVMQNKYGKMLVNLGNAVEAAIGRDAKAPEIGDALRDEARAVLRAAGIDWREMDKSDPRRGTLLSIAPIEGITRVGSSTSQSLARGAGSIETDYFNGEIALIARLNGREAPLNGRMASVAARLARERRPTGSLTPEELKTELGLNI